MFSSAASAPFVSTSRTGGGAYPYPQYDGPTTPPVPYLVCSFAVTEFAQADITRESFVSLLHSELRKVNNFALMKYDGVNTALRQAWKELDEMAKEEARAGDVTTKHTRVSKERLRGKIRAQGEELCWLDWFLRENKDTLQQILVEAQERRREDEEDRRRRAADRSRSSRRHHEDATMHSRRSRETTERNTTPSREVVEDDENNDDDPLPRGAGGGSSSSSSSTSSYTFEPETTTTRRTTTNKRDKDFSNRRNKRSSSSGRSSSEEVDPADTRTGDGARINATGHQGTNRQDPRPRKDKHKETTRRRNKTTAQVDVHELLEQYLAAEGATSTPDVDDVPEQEDAVGPAGAASTNDVHVDERRHDIGQQHHLHPQEPPAAASSSTSRVYANRVSFVASSLGADSTTFLSLQLDELLILLSLTWQSLRGGGSKAEKWRPGVKFVRKTQKYWVPKSEVVRLKTGILEHLPYLIFGKSVQELGKILLQPFRGYQLQVLNKRATNKVVDRESGRNARSNTNSSGGRGQEHNLSKGSQNENQDDVEVEGDRMNDDDTTKSTPAPQSGRQGGTTTFTAARKSNSNSRGTTATASSRPSKTSKRTDSSQSKNKKSDEIAVARQEVDEVNDDPLEDTDQQPDDEEPRVCETQQITSVYLDSPDATCYHRRILREEGARLVRYRWYGESDEQDPNEEIFMERKIHHECWVGDSSTKERFTIPRLLLPQFLQLTRPRNGFLLGPDEDLKDDELPIYSTSDGEREGTTTTTSIGEDEDQTERRRRERKNDRGVQHHDGTVVPAASTSSTSSSSEVEVEGEHQGRGPARGRRAGPGGDRELHGADVEHRRLKITGPPVEQATAQKYFYPGAAALFAKGLLQPLLHRGNKENAVQEHYQRQDEMKIVQQKLRSSSSLPPWYLLWWQRYIESQQEQLLRRTTDETTIGEEELDPTVRDERAEAELRNALQLGREILTLLHTDQLRPMIRTAYKRCAFQSASSNELRISLDVDMRLRKEHGVVKMPDADMDAAVVSTRNPTRQEKARLSRNPATANKDDDYLFPYAILEVKLAGLAENPPWVQDLLYRCRATQVYKFSKFQHAMTLLHYQKVPYKPHWYADFERGGGLAAVPVSNSREDMLGDELGGGYSITGERNYRDENAGTLVTAVDVDGGGRREFDENEGTTNTISTALISTLANQSHKIRNMRVLEAKAFFANERTFVHYAKHGLVFLLFLRYIAHSQNETWRGLSFVLAPFLGTYFVWCLLMYQDRTQILVKQEAVCRSKNYRMDSAEGPLLSFFLAVTLLFAVLVLFFFVDEDEGV
ncbi:unnamed protein product [Amoebophrya sp. A120]|nr:unnamed protein product [Amoebophrya sp. A120]|eukprot:GSA120T00000595001.1